MNKHLVAFSLACVSALAFADNAQWQSPRFAGIGSAVTALDNLNKKATGGAWNVQAGGLTTENASISDGKLVLDLDDSETASFNVTQAAGDTGTLQTIAIKATFTPVSEADILPGSKMNEKNAQVGFAVVNTSGTTCKYYAWVGATGGATSLDDWVELSGEPQVDPELDVQIEVDHWGATPYAVFKVKNGSGNYEALTDNGKQTKFEITSNAKTAESVSSVACTGSGTLSVLSGDVQLGVASIGDRKYPTADAAIQAATSGQTVSLLKDTTGSVTAKDGVKIANNGKSAVIDTQSLTNPIEVTPTATELDPQGVVASGEYVLNVQVSDVSKLTVVSPNPNKQVKSITAGMSGAGVRIELETADACIPGNAGNRDKMRAFLSSQRNAVYTQADSTKANIETALSETAGNGLTYQRCYELGIEATDSIKPVAVASDTDLENITLAIPAIGQKAWAGAHNVTYSIKDSEGTVKASGLTSPKIPLSVGNGTLKVVAVATEK